MKFQEVLKKIWKILRKFPGGFRSPLSYVLLVLLLFAFKAFLKERGMWFKKSLMRQHVFLTGAGSGLGRRMAVQFALNGAKLTISDIDFKSVEETKALIEKKVSKMGGKAEVLALRLDVSDRSEVKRIANQAKQQLGDVDILINNAGIVQGKKFWEMDEFMVHKTMVVNCESHFWLINEFIGSMLKKNSGHIVSIASVAGMAGVPDMTDYCASKFAALGLMESLRIEFKRENINIKTTTICPYFINTGMFDGVTTSMWYPLLEQDDVVARALSAVKQEEEHVCIPWSAGIMVPLAAMQPVNLKDYFSWFFVGWHTMQKFRGRIQQLEEKKKQEQVKNQ